MTKNPVSTKLFFRVVPGARIAQRDASAIGTILERLKSTGSLTAERVVQEATNRRSPLHKHFTWDDAKAANLYRLEQARKLIRSIEVVVQTPKGREVPMRAYFSVRDAEGQRSYQGMTYVFETPALSDQIISEAHAQLQAWVAKYKKYQWARGAIPKVASALRAVQAARSKKK